MPIRLESGTDTLSFGELSLQYRAGRNGTQIVE
jgi:hypothetical protein